MYVELIFKRIINKKQKARHIKKVRESGYNMFAQFTVFEKLVIS